MIPFSSYSQAGQDIFTAALLPKARGTFLDVGCGAPITINNTYALERIGWTGLLVDNSHEAAVACQEVRITPVIWGDAVGLDWKNILPQYFKPGVIDYLSLDIDEASTDALMAILDAGAKFNVITAEHDSYRHGDRLRSAMRERLLRDGYYLVCADVCSADGLPYEDWYCSDALSDDAARFRSTGMKWTDVLKQGIK